MNSDHFAKHNHTKHERRAYSQKRSRRVSSRIDEHPENAATIQFQAYYRKWMCEILDSLIREYRENMEQCLEFGKAEASGRNSPAATDRTNS